MRVRNRIGVPWSISEHNVKLPPGEWVDAPLPRDVALDLARTMKLEIDWRDFYSTTDDYVWQTDGSYHLLWMAPFSLADGYGTASESTLLALREAGLQLYLRPVWFAVLNGLNPVTVQLLQTPLPVGLHPRVGLCMATPGEFTKLHTPYRIGLTMYESDDPLRTHPEWARDFQNVDRVFVPCQYCKDIFSFTDRPIDVVPLATNPLFNIGTTYTREPKSDGEFTFLMHGTLTARKAPLETLDCFMKAFPKKRYPHVRIRFKTRLGIFGRHENLLPDNPDPERIEFINGDWYADQLLEAFKQADAYLFPSRGEGFGMTPREAMASGLITIFSDNTGLSEVADARYNWPIPMTGVEDSPLGGNWYEPDWDYLIDTMRWVVDHREAARHTAQNGAAWFQREHGPEAVARQWFKVLGEIDPSEATPVKLELGEELTPETYPELVAEHEPYFRALQQERPLDPYEPIWDLGVGTGLAYAYLRKRGCRVIGLVDVNDDIDELATRLRALGVEPELYHVNMFNLRRFNWTKPQLIISQGALQQYWNVEVQRIITQVIQLADGVPLVFSVPTINYPNNYREGANLRAMDHWHYVLGQFAVSRSIFYGEDRRHAFFTVKGYNQNIRGVMAKRLGKVTEGVWRPTDVNRLV